MVGELEVKILADNLVNESGLMAEHGLSFWLNYEGNKFLFDTGQGLVLAHNADNLNVDLREITGVIISHGHDDHGGGVRTLLKQGINFTLYAHPEVFKQKYVRDEKDGKLKKAGLNFSRKNYCGQSWG